MATNERVTPITGPNKVPKNINGKLFFSFVKMGILFDFNFPAKVKTMKAAENANSKRIQTACMVGNLSE